jgi:hypothetical protein
MLRATDGSKYVLVIKDDLSGFVQLHPSKTADAVATAKALMAWFTTFGYVETWVPDGGFHFKNEVFEKVRKMIGAHHHITTAYSLLDERHSRSRKPPSPTGCQDSEQRDEVAVG